MARKTPKSLLPLFSRQQDMMRHVDEVLRVKRTVPVENQADHVREKPEEYWIGLADGHNTMLENILHESNCYAGFQHQGLRAIAPDSGEVFIPQIGSDHPEYADWRRAYYVRG